jgi:hypothetical protein
VDSQDWFAYPRELQWRIPLSNHLNLATHFLLLIAGLTPSSVFEFSPDRTNWTRVGLPPGIKNAFAFAIPSELRQLPVIYGRFRGLVNCNNWVAGWGLSSSNSAPLITYPQLEPVSSQPVSAGRLLAVTNSAMCPYSPPDKLEFTLVSGPTKTPFSMPRVACFDGDRGWVTSGSGSRSLSRWPPPSFRSCLPPTTSTSRVEDVSLALRPSPSNDDFSRRLSLNGYSASTTGFTYNPSKELGEPDHAGGTRGAARSGGLGFRRFLAR